MFKATYGQQSLEIDGFLSPLKVLKGTKADPNTQALQDRVIDPNFETTYLILYTGSKEAMFSIPQTYSC